MAREWGAGHGRPAESYLDGQTLSPSEVLDVVYQEYVLRRATGERPGAEEFIGRFPEYREALVRQFELESALSTSMSLRDAQTLAQVEPSTVALNTRAHLATFPTGPIASARTSFAMNSAAAVAASSGASGTRSSNASPL